MTERIYLDAERPKPRRVGEVARILRKGGVVALPTDTNYAFAAALSQRKAVNRLRALKKTSRHHPLSIVVSDMSQLGQYTSEIGPQTFRILKRCFPGPYVFVLHPSPSLPRGLTGSKGQVGVRMPDHELCRELVRQLDEPLVVTSIRMTLEDDFHADPEEILLQYGGRFDALVDCGYIWPEPSSVLDLRDDEVDVLREGKGDLSWLD